MKVSIVFPPSICLPNQLYYSLPVLAAVVERAGHEAHAVDLNLAAADMLLTDERAERYLRIAHDMDRASDADLGPMLRALEPKVRDGPFCKDVLRDPVRCYDQPLFRRAFWNVVDALAFYYQLDPVFSPFREDLARDLAQYQRRDPWTPMRDLYEEGLLDEVLGAEPDLIAVSCVFPEQAAETIRMAAKLRARRPQAHLAIGGPLLNTNPETWLADGWIFEYFDSVVVGDGVRAMEELLEAVEGRRGFENVTNLAYRDPGGRVRRNHPTPRLESFDEMPDPDFGSIDMGRFLTPLPIYPLMVSRGCYWGKCTFCSFGWRENYRAASPERIRRLARNLAHSYGARYVQVQDSSVPPRGARVLAETIRDEDLGLHWSGEMKLASHFLDREYCETLHAGGCRSLLMGFESASQAVVDLMDKGYDQAEVPAILSNLRESGVSTELSWFIGFPTDTPETVLATVRWLYEHKDLFGLCAFVGDYQLHPDTDVFREPERFGVTVLGVDNGACRYELREGIPQELLSELKRILAVTNNRTLVCNSAHLPHLVESGLDLSQLEFPIVVPEELEELCATP